MKIVKYTLLLTLSMVTIKVYTSQKDRDEFDPELSLVAYQEKNYTKNKKSLYTPERPKTPHTQRILSPIPQHSFHYAQKDYARPTVDIIAKNRSEEFQLSDEQIETVKKKHF